YQSDFTEGNFGPGWCGWATDNLPSAPACEILSHVLEPGEGFIIINNGLAVTNTWTGCIPNCPLPCAPQIGVTNFIGPVGVITNPSYTNLFSCPPPCGTLLSMWPGSGYTNFLFVNGAWTPRVPVIPAGTAVFVTVTSNTNCATTNGNCLPTDVNGVYQANG